MRDDEITIGMQVKIKEGQKSAPFNGAVGTVVAAHVADGTGRLPEGATYYEVDLYGGRYFYAPYDIESAGDA
jgi:hypothetical protein